MGHFWSLHAGLFLQIMGAACVPNTIRCGCYSLRKRKWHLLCSKSRNDHPVEPVWHSATWAPAMCHIGVKRINERKAGNCSRSPVVAVFFCVFFAFLFIWIQAGFWQVSLKRQDYFLIPITYLIQSWLSLMGKSRRKNNNEKKKKKKRYKRFHQPKHVFLSFFFFFSLSTWSFCSGWKTERPHNPRPSRMTAIL